MSRLRVAAIQVAIDDASPADRFDAVEEAVRAEAEAGAELVVLPELWLPGFFGSDAFESTATTLRGHAIRRLRRLASDAGVLLHAGSFVERDGGHLYNTSILVDERGFVLATYRKIHLFGHAGRERELLTAGSRPVVATANDLTIGLATCYDLRFPELFRLLAEQGAQLFVVVAAWPAARREAWRLLCRSRALENQAFLVGCNAAGAQAGVIYAGSSLVVGPDGEEVVTCGREADVARATLDPADVAAARTAFPALVDRVLGPL